MRSSIAKLSFFDKQKGSKPQSSNSPSSPGLNFKMNSSISVRKPIVHFFISDYENAKVKSYSEQFIQLLLSNGIDVFTEKFPTHQPGFQVSAASLHTDADFFIQIHSKTAQTGHVRLYIGGKPNRMKMEEAIAATWSWWRLKCGCLGQEEVELLSSDKIIWALVTFAKIDPQNFDFSSIQIQARESITRGTTLRPIVIKLNHMKTELNEAISHLDTLRPISPVLEIGVGVELQRFAEFPKISGISTHLKDVLVLSLEQAIQKANSLIAVLENQLDGEKEMKTFDEFEEKSNEHSLVLSGNSWTAMLESIEEGHFGMVIASYGDNGSLDPLANLPYLDEYY